MERYRTPHYSGHFIFHPTKDTSIYKQDTLVWFLSINIVSKTISPANWQGHLAIHCKAVYLTTNIFYMKTHVLLHACTCILQASTCINVQSVLG